MGDGLGNAPNDMTDSEDQSWKASPPRGTERDGIGDVGGQGGVEEVRKNNWD